MRNIERLSLRPLRRARRETIRHHLKLVRFLRGKSPSTEYDWGCDVPAAVRPDHRGTVFVTFARGPNQMP
jgi:hypothetical protein